MTSKEAAVPWILVMVTLRGPGGRVRGVEIWKAEGVVPKVSGRRLPLRAILKEEAGEPLERT
jgi:hypothetical protein